MAFYRRGEESYPGAWRGGHGVPNYFLRFDTQASVALGKKSLPQFPLKQRHYTR